MIRLPNILLALAATTLILMNACNDKTKTITGIYEHGVIITNEGLYGANTGSVSYYNPVTDSIYNDIFELVNKNPLGDVVQSFSAAEDKGFIVINNSNKVDVVLLSSFKLLGSIVATLPRHLITVNSGKAYLTSQGYPGQVLVVNTSSMAVLDTIVVGNQPDNLLQVGSKVFVANGNYGNDSTVSVIDVFTDKLIQTVNVGVGACNLVCSDGQNIWIICQGQKVYDNNYNIIKEIDSHLVEISASDYNIKYSKIIGVKGDACSPFLISSDKAGNIYYAEADGVHKLNPNTTNLQDQLFIPWANSSGLSIYGLSVDPNTSNIYLMEAKGFTSAGKFHIYNSAGVLLHTMIAGIAPNGAVTY